MLLDDIKTALRITHNKLDEDIRQHINSCFADMKRVGIKIPEDTENCPPLFNTAVKLYVKAHYNFQDKGQDFQKNYERLRDNMSLYSEYSEGDTDV